MTMVYILTSSGCGWELVLMSLHRMSRCSVYVRMDTESLQLDLEYITQARALPEGETLGQVLTRLDTVAKDPNLHERLQHYLSKRSYVKALAWLADPNIPHHP